jgi:hypothetical protein
MKTEEDEAFDDLAKKQGSWGGGYQAKRKMAADKFIAAEERKVGERYGYVPKLHPSEWMNDHNEDNLDMVAQPAQQPSITRPCRSCDGAGDRDTGIPESPIATCKPCNGTGQIALAQPAQEPVAWITPDGEGFRIRFSAPTNDVPLGWDALYTTPPKREWVGLTDDEIDDAAHYCVKSGQSVNAAIRAIEAKLKEKNT